MKVGTDGILLGAWTPVAGAKTMLDVGTGTGLLALMLAQRQPVAIIDALELDGAAAQQAKENVSKSPWPERVQVWHTAVQKYTQIAAKRYDLVVCNPPFWTADSGTLAPTLPRRQSRQATTLTLDDLLACVNELLAERGRFCCILPVTTGLLLTSRAKNVNLFCHKRVDVKPIPAKPVHRLLLEFGRGERLCQREGLVLENGRRHDYSEAFISLTQNFYLNF